MYALLFVVTLGATELLFDVRRVCRQFAVRFCQSTGSTTRTKSAF